MSSAATNRQKTENLRILTQNQVRILYAMPNSMPATTCKLTLTGTVTRCRFNSYSCWWRRLGRTRFQLMNRRSSCLDSLKIAPKALSRLRKPCLPSSGFSNCLAPSAEYSSMETAPNPIHLGIDKDRSGFAFLFMSLACP